MDVNEVIKDINYICLVVAIFIFLVIKFLNYLLSKERLKLKKSTSLFNSVNSVRPHSI